MQTDTEDAAKEVPISKLIFVVEDDEANAEMLRLAIELETSYRVLRVANGSEALAVVQKVKPDVILLDYGLPKMHGLEVYERLRAIPGGERVPVVFLTAAIHRVGGEASHLPCIEKPFELDILLEILRQQPDRV